MSREAFEAWADAFWDGDVGHLTPNGCMWNAWQAAQADAYERAAKVCDELYDSGGTAYGCADAIRALAKETK